MEQGIRTRLLTAYEMMELFRAQHIGEGETLPALIEVPFLAIDDLGTEVVNQFTLSCLYHVINTRLNLQKPTIISTNLTPGELRKLYSDRISSRLTGEFQVIPFYGTDVRKQKLQSK